MPKFVNSSVYHFVSCILNRLRTIQWFQSRQPGISSDAYSKVSDILNFQVLHIPNEESFSVIVEYLREIWQMFPVTFTIVYWLIERQKNISNQLET